MQCTIYDCKITIYTDSLKTAPSHFLSSYHPSLVRVMLFRTQTFYLSQLSTEKQFTTHSLHL